MSHTRNTKENIINETVPHNDIEEAQAPSIKPENLHAANTQSFKPQATEKNPKRQAPSSKPQASSRKRQAL